MNPKQSLHVVGTEIGGTKTESTNAQNMSAALGRKRSRSHRGNGRKRRTPGHDPIKHSGKSMHKYEELKRSQEKLILSVGGGLLIGALLGFAMGGYYPLTIGTGLALGLGFGILSAS